MLTVAPRRIDGRAVLVPLEQVQRWSRFARAQYSRISPGERPLASAIIANLQRAEQRRAALPTPSASTRTVVAPVDEWTLGVLLAMFDHIAGGGHPLSKIKLFVNYAREQAADVQLALVSLDLTPTGQVTRS